MSHMSNKHLYLTTDYMHNTILTLRIYAFLYVYTPTTRNYFFYSVCLCQVKQKNKYHSNNYFNI